MDPAASLSKLQHTSSVRGYQTKFEILANRVNDLPESYLISCFILGLREDIKVGVCLLRPAALSKAFDLAICQEESVWALQDYSIRKMQ